MADELAEIRAFNSGAKQLEKSPPRVAPSVHAALARSNFQILVNPNVSNAVLNDAGRLALGQRLVDLRRELDRQFAAGNLLNRYKAGLRAPLIGRPEVGGRRGQVHAMFIAKFDAETRLDLPALKRFIVDYLGLPGVHLSVKWFRDTAAVADAYAEKAAEAWDRGDIARATVARE